MAMGEGRIARAPASEAAKPKWKMAVPGAAVVAALKKTLGDEEGGGCEVQTIHRKRLSAKKAGREERRAECGMDSTPTMHSRPNFARKPQPGLRSSGELWLSCLLTVRRPRRHLYTCRDTAFSATSQLPPDE